MFFDGTWHTEFSEKLMTTGLFKRKDAEPVSVSYMTKTEYIQVGRLACSAAPQRFPVWPDVFVLCACV